MDGDPVYREIHGGGSHTCAVDESGQAFCWGRNWRGELGTTRNLGNRIARPWPVEDPVG